MLPKELKYSLLLVIICFLVYFNSLQGQFVSDDIDGVANSSYANISVPSIVMKCFLYKTFGNNPLPYHLSSVILNAINTVLLFFILQSFFEAIPSLIGALFFAVHPLHTEAVSWISGDGYLYMCLFTFLILLIYRKNFICYLLSILLFTYFCSGNFPGGILISIFILLYELSSNKKPKFSYILPYFAIAGIIFLTNFLAIHERIAVIEKAAVWGKGIPIVENPFVLMIHCVFNNLFNLFIPYNLTIYHEPIIILPDQRIFFEGVVVILIFVMLIGFWKKNKGLFWGLSVFLIGFTPSYLPKSIAWLIADRYNYLPSVFLSTVVAYLYTKYPKKNVLTILGIVFLIYAFRTVARNEDYRTPIKFWEATVRASPDSPRSHNELGISFINEGNYGKAVEELQSAVNCSPNYIIPWQNLALAFQYKGEQENAQKALAEVKRLGTK